MRLVTALLFIKISSIDVYGRLFVAERFRQLLPHSARAAQIKNCKNHIIYQQGHVGRECLFVRNFSLKLVKPQDVRTNDR